MTLERIHHINFIFRDLEAATKMFARLGVGPFEHDELPARGVRTARAKLGEVWLVLVSPVDEHSEPGRYLAKHGEGFFLLSFGVDDLARTLTQLSEHTSVGPPRRGLLDWQVADLAPEQTLGIQLQIAATSKQNPV